MVEIEVEEEDMVVADAVVADVVADVVAEELELMLLLLIFERSPLLCTLLSSSNVFRPPLMRNIRSMTR